VDSVERKCFKFGCVSAIGLGTYGIGGYTTPDYSMDEQGVEALRRGLELGVNLIDTAELYGGGHSEELVGIAIRDFERDDLFIVTKVLPHRTTFDQVVDAVTASARRLGTYIDLILVHAYPGDRALCTVMKALESLISRGIARFLGVSNFSVEQIESARTCLSKEDVVAVQNRYSLLYRHDEHSVIPYTERNNMMYMAYTPLERGRLLEYEVLRKIGEKYGRTPVQVLLNWYLFWPTVVPIPKSSRRDHVEEIVGGAGWRMSLEDWRFISEVFRR